MARIDRFLPAILLGLTLASCQGGSATLRISSDIPGMELLAELYQTEHPDMLVQIVPGGDTAASAPYWSSTDLVVDRYLDNPVAHRWLSDLSTLPDWESRLEPRLQGTFGFTCIHDGSRIPLIMVSFNLPTLVSPADRTGSVRRDTMLRDLDELRIDSVSTPPISGEPVKSLHFSIRQSPSFLLAACTALGADITPDRQGYPVWDNTKLSQALHWLRDWMIRQAGSTAAEKAFVEKYGYIPLPALLGSGRLATGYMDLSSLMNLPPDIRSSLQMGYLSRKERIHILDDAVMAGIPRESRSKEQAASFLAWMLSPDTQKRYLDFMSDTGVSDFGFLEGLSTQRMVTEKHIPVKFRSLQGMIPSESSLEPPMPLPQDWKQLRDSALADLLEQIAFGESPPDTLSLESALSRWYLQRGFEPRF